MAFAVAKVPYLQFDLHQLSRNWDDDIEFNDHLPQRQVYRLRCGGTSFLGALWSQDLSLKPLIRNILGVVYLTSIMCSHL